MPNLPGETEFLMPREAGGHLHGYLHDTGTPRLGIFVHGFRSDCAGNKSTGLAQHAAAMGHSWLRFDLSAHGRSGGEFRHFRLSLLLADLLAVLAHFHRREVILVGSSMGGWLAVLAALRRPEQVKGLVLLAPAFNFIQSYFAALPAPELDAWRDAGVRTFEGAYDGRRFELEYELLADTEQFDLLRAPQRLACPVIVFHGEDDEAVPVAVSRRFVDRLSAPESALHVLPGEDHRLNGAIPTIARAVDRLWRS